MPDLSFAGWFWLAYVLLVAAGFACGFWLGSLA